MQSTKCFWPAKPTWSWYKSAQHSLACTNILDVNLLIQAYPTCSGHDWIDEKRSLALQQGAASRTSEAQCMVMAAEHFYKCQTTKSCCKQGSWLQQHTRETLCSMVGYFATLGIRHALPRLERQWTDSVPKWSSRAHRYTPWLGSATYSGLSQDKAEVRYQNCTHSLFISLLVVVHTGMSGAFLLYRQTHHGPPIHILSGH